MVNFFFTKCMANDDFSGPPRRADSENRIFIFCRFLDLGHLRGPRVSLGRILFGGGGGPGGSIAPPPPPQLKARLPQPWNTTVLEWPYTAKQAGAKMGQRVQWGQQNRGYHGPQLRQRSPPPCQAQPNGQSTTFGRWQPPPRESRTRTGTPWTPLPDQSDHRGKTKLNIVTILSGHVWYTTFWVPGTPPPLLMLP